MVETIQGEVKRVTYENEESHFRVLKVQVPARGLITAVGKFPFVGTGSSVRLTGEFTRDAKHGEQFRVQALVAIEPETLQGIERYLASGIIPGVGPGFAKRIVEAFGDQTLKVLDEDSARLREVPVSSWNYLTQEEEVRHVGPMAQDFHAAYGLNGDDDRHLLSVDTNGVALAAIQGLNAKLERENAARYVTIRTNVRGRDLVGFVDEARARIARQELVEVQDRSYHHQEGAEAEEIEDDVHVMCSAR